MKAVEEIISKQLSNNDGLLNYMYIDELNNFLLNAKINKAVRKALAFVAEYIYIWCGSFGLKLKRC